MGIGSMQCLKRGHTLSEEELDRGHCYQCDAIDKGLVSESYAKRRGWRFCDKHKRLYWVNKSDSVCPRCLEETLYTYPTLSNPRHHTPFDYIFYTLFYVFLLAVVLGIVYGAMMGFRWMVAHWPFK